MTPEDELQRKHVRLTGLLIEWVYAQGWELSWGEAWRTPQQAEWDAQHGTGIAHSLHIQRLAIDFNLFIGDVFQTTKEAYQPLGDYWKSLDPDAKWGGDFSSPDSDHFSLEFQGYK